MFKVSVAPFGVDFSLYAKQTDKSNKAPELPDLSELPALGPGLNIAAERMTFPTNETSPDANTWTVLPEDAEAPWRGIQPIQTEIQHYHGCDCGNCSMPEERDVDENGDEGTVTGTTTASAPAILGDLADYLVSGYWTRNGSSIPERFHNVTDQGIDPNDGVLLFNVSGFADDADGISEERAFLVREAFKLFEATLGIQFVETTSTDTSTVDFFFRDNDSGAYASTGYYSNGEYTYSRINLAESWSGGTSTYNDYTLQTIFHEIGHALGLGHQGGYNGSATYGVDNDFENDSWQASMMSYFSQTENTTIDAPYEFLQTPMSVDWMALDVLYGRQGYGVANAFTEDTVWGFNTTVTSEVSDIWAQWSSYANTTASTIVDSGGIDTLDLSGYSNNAVINLAPSDRGSTAPSLSDIGGSRGNLSIAEGTIIENAIGGSAGEVFFGNVADNIFTGNGGNDTFNDSTGNDTYLGGAGTDTVSFGQAFADFTYNVVGTFLQVIDVAIDLVDITVEWLSFTDGLRSWDEVADTATPNTDPVANADSINVDEDATASGNVLSNDTDADGDALNVVSVNGQAASVGTQITLASGALVTLNANGTFDYDPNGAFDALLDGQAASDSFDYAVSDGRGGTSSASVNVTVNGVTEIVNLAPNAAADSATVGEDIILSNLNVLGNDSDPDGDAIAVTEIGGVSISAGGFVTLASGARVTLNGDGTLRYDQQGAFDSLNDGQTATETFAYTISDGQGGTDTATVTLTINGVTDNQGPVAVNDSGTVTEDAALSGNVLTNDTDADGDSLTVTAVNGQAGAVGNQITLSSGALVTLNANGSYDYDQNGAFDTLATGQSGSDSFSYTVSDGNGGTDTATVNITINGVTDNVAPNAANDSGSVAENATLAGNVLANDSDGNGDSLSVTAVNGQAGAVGNQITLSSGATVTLNANGSDDYDPNGAFDALATGETGSDSFSYTVSDGNGGTDTATVNITINGVSPPVTTTPLLIDFESAALGNFAGVDDIDVTGLNVRSGTTLSGSRFAESTGFTLITTGEDFDLDGAVFRSAGGRVRLNIEAWDDGVLVGTQTVNARSNRDSTVSLGTAFDSVDEIRVTANGTFYVDDLSLVTRTVEDPGGNLDPTAVNDAFSTGEGQSVGFNLLANDSDPDGGTPELVSVAGDTDGTVTLQSGAVVTFAADGSITYDPNGAFDDLYDGQSQNDSFVYEIADGQGGSDTATATVTIVGSGTPPPAPTTYDIGFEGAFSGNTYTEDGFIFSDVIGTSASLGVSGGSQAIQSTDNSIILENVDGFDFDFESAVITALGGRNVQLSVQGFDNGVLVGSDTIRIRDNRETSINFDDALFDQVDQIVLTASGGLIVDDLVLIG